jgi:hypothetical protein
LLPKDYADTIVQMNDSLFTLAQHFGPLNSTLNDLSAKAYEAWPEGGMSWSVKYCHGTAHTIKIDGEYVTRSMQSDHEIDLQNYSFQWAKLIWRAHGNNETLMNISGNTEWAAEENRLIAEHDETAKQLISLFQTSGASKVRMSFIDDLSLSITCISVFGQNALIYDIFWSFD